MNCNLINHTRIRRAGYPIRHTFKEFVERYYVLQPGMVVSQVPDMKLAAKTLCTKVLGSHDWQIGNTKVFIKVRTLHHCTAAPLSHMTITCTVHIVTWQSHDTAYCHMTRCLLPLGCWWCASRGTPWYSTDNKGCPHTEVGAWLLPAPKVSSHEKVCCGAPEKLQTSPRYQEIQNSEELAHHTQQSTLSSFPTDEAWVHPSASHLQGQEAEQKVQENEGQGQGAAEALQGLPG